VANLLTHGDLELPAIAHRSGFKHVEYLSVAFKNHAGVLPSAYCSGVQT
jgi:AraC-like DNA-binding protein